MAEEVSYYGIRFLISYFSFVTLLYLLKRYLQKFIHLKHLLFLFTVFSLIFCIKINVTKDIFLCFLYMYFFYYLYTNNHYQETLFPAIVIAFPLLLVKLNINPIYKSLGLSYMTFRTVQAIVDHKNYGKLSFVEFTIFLLLPTSLLAGPIDRSYRLKKDLDLNYKNLNLRNFLKAWEILILGVLFKFIIAYAINKFWLMKINVNSTNFTTIANSAYAYSTYLFFDFSGYSAMAVGFSRILGINMPRNFNHPFLAQNPQDFWRRFHITLGTWLTDYFFKPSYKSLLKVNFFKKKRLLAQNLAITATFIFMGFWNGFTWYYICSGLLFGLASSLHNSYLSYIKVGGFDYFELLPNILKINLKRFLMLHTAILALYIFSGRVPL